MKNDQPVGAAFARMLGIPAKEGTMSESQRDRVANRVTTELDPILNQNELEKFFEEADKISERGQRLLSERYPSYE